MTENGPSADIDAEQINVQLDGNTRCNPNSSRGTLASHEKRPPARRSVSAARVMLVGENSGSHGHRSSSKYGLSFVTANTHSNSSVSAATTARPSTSSLDSNPSTEPEAKSTGVICTWPKFDETVKLTQPPSGVLLAHPPRRHRPAPVATREHCSRYVQSQMPTVA